MELIWKSGKYGLTHDIKMNKNIKISIVTPSYNQGDFIEKTIQSVLNQTYKNIEYIIVDGGSTDQTLKIIDKYRNRIATVISEKDKGQSEAINKGFKLATGDLAGWINSDDILYPDCVEKIVELYNTHPDGCIYYPAMLDIIDREGKLLYKSVRKISNRNHLLNKNYSIIQQGSFYDSRLMKKICYLDESIYYCMDLDLWLRLLKENDKIYFFNSYALSAFRVWEGTKTTKGAAKFLQNTKQVLENHGAKKNSLAQFHLIYTAFRIWASGIKRKIISK